MPPHQKPRTKPGKPGQPRQTSLQVTEPCELMKFLLAQMPAKGRNNIKQLLAHHQIMVDDVVVTQYNHPLAPGQQVLVNGSKVPDQSAERLEILFEDSYLIVINKPAGLLSIATAQEKEQTAYSILSEHLKKTNPQHRIFVVHRLDRETSGVMMFAKSVEVQQALQNAWQEVVLERTYVAVAEGQVSKTQGTITSWLKESKTLLMYSSRTPNDGQKAITHYKVLKQNKLYSLLELELETGRKNQIRVHLQDLGHSTVGDKKYGSTKNPLQRLCLHARVLAFRHPVNGQTVRYETPIPPEFLNLFS